jgi:predicted kinase
VAKLVVIVGLPGSGKSTHLPRLMAEHGATYWRDSFKKNALRDCSHITHSRHYGSLLHALLKGENCVIADIDFCREQARREAVEFIALHAPTTEVIWYCFENSPDQCRKNVITSQRGVDGRLRRIDEFKDQYTLPHGVTPEPVWDGRGAPYDRTTGGNEDDDVLG